ncbi:BREX system P-loop protein BrxC [Adlercreutzia aquisgranensis]|uniref:BREX system P-loop protein BrxC n=1 Tax=Adlercreutzia aquisgranensis TaxID=2941323 RepID=UPI00203C5C2C|nr:BREX system P-loop protein BrxC [Adlercreutzia aquisgranensis]
MEIKQLFEKDINRSINGVIKVGQDDEALVKQELSEYVVTRELARHFADFFENYSSAIDQPTDKIGVWITGFFGSGKSHFLKMLSYLLSNRVVDGTPAIDYFDGKVQDPMVYNMMRRSVGVPTEAILFNIDTKAGQWKEGTTARTALLRAFARVFYEHLGFFGEDLKLARLEAYADSKGKTEQFREAFAQVNGGDWLEERASYDFLEDDIVEVLGQVLGMSEEAARRFFDSSTDEALAPDVLVTEIKKYVDRRSQECGGDFRLLFMVDEVGQFIGDDVNLMLNLQTLVEELGSRCQGKVWVMVTSQEAIDKVVKVAGDDFSKIQGRFNTRLTLSSSSVDEVIKRRVLQKTPQAAQVLKGEYDQNSSVLKNLFTFENSQSDLLGYAGPDEFEQSYPFVSYQFKLMPKVFAEIRRHGNAGKHLASGERSMLSGFQESAQKVEGCDLSALVPLWYFYDTLAKSLDHEIRQVIDRAERAAADGLGLQPHDVAVLKTLYLIHYIKDVYPTLGNIATLTVDSMDVDKVALRERVKDSLARLARENYVARYGDTYTFLTDEEQDVEREIKETAIDAANVVERIKRIVFDGIYAGKRRYRVGSSDFAFDRYVDDSLYAQGTDGMKLNIITAAHELAKADRATLALKSPGQALVVLAGDEDYYEVLANAAKIEKYVKTQNINQLPETKQAIIKAKNREASNADREAQRIIEAALVNAAVMVDGQPAEVRAGKADAFIDEVLSRLTGAIYTKADYVGSPVEGEGDVKAILLGSYQQSIAGSNDRALQDMEQFLEAQAQTHSPTSVADVRRRYIAVPYGWRDIDVAALLARLALDQKIVVERSGVQLGLRDPKMLAALTKSGERESTQVRKRERLDDAVMVPARKLLKDLTGQISIPDDEDGLVGAVAGYLDDTAQTLKALLADEYRHAAYPGKGVVEEGERLTTDIGSHGGNPHSLLKAFLSHKDALLDFADDYQEVQGFFPNQQRIYDDALGLVKAMEGETDYLDDPEAAEALRQVAEIVAMDSPYKRIKDLPELMEKVRSVHGAALSQHRRELLDRIEEARVYLLGYVEERRAPGDFAGRIERDMTGRREDASKAASIVRLEALTAQVGKYRDDMVVAMDDALERQKAQAASAAAPPSAPTQVVPASQSGSAPAASEVRTSVARAADPAPQPIARTKVLRRSDVCPPTKLSNDQEVEDYVRRIREQLLSAVREYGSVRLMKE